MNFQKTNNIAGWTVFAISLIVYWISMEETASYWDCGEFIAVSYKLEVPHPPGAPFYLLIGRLFSFLAFGDVTQVAYWINFSSVLASSFCNLFLFWSITLLGRKIFKISNFSEITEGQTWMLIGSGLNSRLDELQAYFLCQKLSFLDQWNQERRNLADLYLQHLHEVGDLLLPLSDKEAYHVYHLFVIRSAHRDELKELLGDEGIETLIHYPIPLHLQPAFSSVGFRRGDFPVSESVANQGLSLPLWPGMTEGMVDRICEVIKKFFKKKGY